MWLHDVSPVWLYWAAFLDTMCLYVCALFHRFVAPREFQEKWTDEAEVCCTRARDGHPGQEVIWRYRIYIAISFVNIVSTLPWNCMAGQSKTGTYGSNSCWAILAIFTQQLGRKIWLEHASYLVSSVLASDLLPDHMLRSRNAALIAFSGCALIRQVQSLLGPKGFSSFGRSLCWCLWAFVFSLARYTSWSLITWMLKVILYPHTFPFWPFYRCTVPRL